jgi:hypothetical protein
MVVEAKAVLLQQNCWLTLLSRRANGFKLFHILEQKGVVLLSRLLPE